MSVFSKLSRTDVSALVSVALFGMTILVSAVGPAQAQGDIITETETSSPTVSSMAKGYRA